MATKIIDNGPFDPRITSIPFVTAAPGYKGDNLTRGWIIQEKAVNGARYRCNFLYNPSVVSVSHSVNANVIADDNAINPYDVTAQDLLLPLQQTVSFSLLFDRTYELWDPSKLHGAAKDNVPFLGVAWDVLSLYKITGVASPIDVDAAKSSDSGAVQSSSFTKGNFKSGATGPMLYVPVYVVFGYTLDYYGVIQEMDVQYTHWTQQMIPSRCQVDISMQLLPRGSAKNGARPTTKVLMPGQIQIGSGSILNPANNGRAGR
ncbi:hypothetical protein PV336_15885 [Streptomyces sp. MI02-2A]|uniref:hypothetical protein n=1 Tax=Streptomyces sp. MI02-2A TaxID=3028688 RepID=UPI0029B6DCFC|nr:hypothetical protein [Streptomyces sp. MI02-2A]MDX3260700.1 hypothetical protein [Streptomyces sp. MI02-2A]